MNNILPNFLNGKEKSYEETFTSPTVSSETEAYNVLAKIREAHPKQSGWIEGFGKVEKTCKGWVAVRYHAKYV